MKSEINQSIIAQGGSNVSDANIRNNNINVNQVKRASFLKGFLSGVASSLVATALWQLFQDYL
ncbi:MAG: hypothetical protein II318_02010 [Bacteroidales bacterium]|nr:hypothetical protein [Bacteroidales bacterium]